MLIKADFSGHDKKKKKMVERANKIRVKNIDGNTFFADGYDVSHIGFERWHCGCKYYEFRGECKHIIATKRHVGNNDHE